MQVQHDYEQNLVSPPLKDGCILSTWSYIYKDLVNTIETHQPDTDDIPIKGLVKELDRIWREKFDLCSMC